MQPAVRFRRCRLAAIRGASYLARHPPDQADDVSRAVVAATLMREREVVIERLRRMGAQILEAPAGQIGPALLARYLDLKRRDML